MTKGNSDLSTGQGPATDRNNFPVRDPTENVSNQLEAAVQRLDDLRRLEVEYARSSRKHAAKELRREMELRARHYSELRKLEAKRINDIHKADQATSTKAAEVSALQTQTLAQQTATLAETLRVQVASVATATAATLATTVEPILKRLEELSRVQYEQAGQQAQKVDARTDPLLAAIRDLQDDQRRRQGGGDERRESHNNANTQLALVFTGMLVVVGILSVLAFLAFHK